MLAAMADPAVAPPAPPPQYFRQNTFKSPLNWLKFTKKHWSQAPKTPGAHLFTDPGSATVAVGYSTGTML